MIKVAFLIRSLRQGGAERQLTTLVSRMDLNKFDVTIITFYAGGEFSRDLAGTPARLLTLNKKGRWDLWAVWRLLKVLRQLRPAILHSYLIEPNLIAVFLKPLLKSAKVVWGIRSSRRDLSTEDWFIRMNWKIQPFFSRFADLIIFNSHDGRAHHVGLGFPSRTSIVIHSGVDVEVFKPDRELGLAVRRDWGQTPDKVLIGLVGRLDPVKDHPTFLRAAALVVKQVPDCNFVCVGAGPDEYAASLRSLADKLGLAEHVIWTGRRADMPSVYNALNIVCSSSASEALPNAIAEAMACDVPCVVTNVGDAATLVGDTGLVVAPNDPQALADGLRNSLESPGTKPRPSPRQRIIREFDVRRLVERTQATLINLVRE